MTIQHAFGLQPVWQQTRFARTLSASTADGTADAPSAGPHDYMYSFIPSWKDSLSPSRSA